MADSADVQLVSTRDALGRFTSAYKAPKAWKPGQSGNPKGSPKRSIAGLIRQALNQNPDIAVAMAERLMREALENDRVEWMRTFLDRYDGPINTISIQADTIKAIVMVPPKGEGLPGPRKGDIAQEVEQ